MVMLWHNIAVIYLEIGETHCFPISRNFLRRAWSWEKQCFSCFLTLFDKGPGNERNEKWAVLVSWALFLEIVFLYVDMFIINSSSCRDNMQAVQIWIAAHHCVPCALNEKKFPSYKKAIKCSVTEYGHEIKAQTPGDIQKPWQDSTTGKWKPF